MTETKKSDRKEFKVPLAELFGGDHGFKLSDDCEITVSRNLPLTHRFNRARLIAEPVDVKVEDNDLHFTVPLGSGLLFINKGLKDGSLEWGGVFLPSAYRGKEVTHARLLEISIIPVKAKPEVNHAATTNE